MKSSWQNRLHVIIYQWMAGWESVRISDITPELGFFLVTEMEKSKYRKYNKWFFLKLFKLFENMGKIKRNQGKSSQKLNWI